MNLLLRSISVLALAGFCVSCGSPAPQNNLPVLAPRTLPTIPQHVLVTPQTINHASCRPADPSNPSEIAKAKQIALGVLIDEDGHVTETAIAQGSGFNDLDQSLIRTVVGCSYRPATLDAKPIPLVAYIDYGFKLAPSPLSLVQFPAPGKPNPIYDKIFPIPAVGGTAVASRYGVKPPMSLSTSPTFSSPQAQAPIDNEHYEATAVVLVLIGADGTVMDTQVVESSGYADLDQAIERKVKTYRFRPGTINEKPAPMLVSITYNFVISNQ